jgi:hypothetical protein
MLVSMRFPGNADDHCSSSAHGRMGRRSKRRAGLARCGLCGGCLTRGSAREKLADTRLGMA